MDQEKAGQRVGFLSFLVDLGLIVLHVLACAVYFGHLAYGVFEDSWLLPMELTGLGLGLFGS